MNSFWREGIETDHEPHAVKMVRGLLVDHSRGNREVALKCYYPHAHGLTHLPLVVWSHGLGGSVDGAAFISRFLTSHGYVVLHVQHAGTDSSMWEGKPGHPWDIIKATHIPRSLTLARFHDIPFVLDNMSEFLKDHPDIKEHLDMGSIGVSGHSFGALTTQVLVGQQFPNEQGILEDYSDSRFKAGILYSPIPEFRLSGFLPQDIYGTINRPVFHMTGTDDDSPIGEFDYTKRLDVFDHSDKAEKLLMVLKEGDHMVYNGSRGKLGQNPHRLRHEALIKISALAFWDATLKNDKKAHKWLTGGGFATYLNGNGEFKVG